MFSMRPIASIVAGALIGLALVAPSQAATTDPATAGMDQPSPASTTDDGASDSLETTDPVDEPQSPEIPLVDPEPTQPPATDPPDEDDSNPETEANTTPEEVSHQQADQKPVATSTIPVSGFAPKQLVAGATNRLAGNDRYGTSVALSQQLFRSGTSAATVFVASGTSYADGLTLGALAAHKGGPLLLTRSDSVPDSVKKEISRLKPSAIVIAGQTAAVSRNVENQLKRIAPVQRLGGRDRFATSRIIAEQFSGADSAFLATGLAFPDALVAATASFKAPGNGAPVLLNKGFTLGPDSEAALRALKPQHVFTVGGNWNGSHRRITDATEASIKALSGRDRYQTSATVAAYFWGSPRTVAYSTGRDFADAMSASPAGRAYDAPILLVGASCRSAEVARVAANQNTRILVGGPAVVRPYVEQSQCGTVGPAVTKSGNTWNFGMRWVAQANGFYCGPATAYMVLQRIGYRQSVSGDALSQSQLAQAKYLKTDYYEATRWKYNMMAQGLNKWMGQSGYRQKGAPNADFLRAKVLDSVKTTGRPVVLDADEVNGGLRYNGHPHSSSFSHLMPVQGYDQNRDELIILDPASHFYAASQQEFRYSVSSFAPFLRAYGIYY